MSAETTAQPIGRLPMRRIITLVFVAGAIAAGINYASSDPAATVAAEPAAIVATTQSATAQPVASGAPICDGSIINTACATVEGNDPGPVIALGWATAPQARFHCAGGEVITLYRQQQIVGYGCAK